MKRKALVMSVHPGVHEEYERRHSPIWPELESVLKEHGVLSYSIFVNRETRQLFGYTEVEDDGRWLAIADTAACKDLMPSNPDTSPVSRELKDVFHIDSQRKNNPSRA